LNPARPKPDPLPASPLAGGGAKPTCGQPFCLVLVIKNTKKQGKKVGRKAFFVCKLTLFKPKWRCFTFIDAKGGILLFSRKIF
jgi:hypothetical protein